MKRLFFFLSAFLMMAITGCRDDESYKANPTPTEPGTISLDITGRVGTIVDGDLTTYIKSINLLLFRRNPSGDYLLYRTTILNKSQLEALADGENGEAGFTSPKVITFDTVPVGNYLIVGVGNVNDSTGAPIRDVSLANAQIGQSISQIFVRLADSSPAPRIFWGSTDMITVGGALPTPPVLRMYRKVAMFAFTVKNIPSVVNRITMEIGNISGAFDMLGDFLATPNISLVETKDYTIQAGDSVTLTYVTFPTIEIRKSTFDVTFYLEGGTKQNIALPDYVLKQNTITRLTATIDEDQPGGNWKVDFNAIITVNVEWNVDQEPPIII